MDDWVKFDETSLPEREDYYSNLSMKYITDADNVDGKRICKDFKIKNLGEYHDFYVQIDTLLLADVFENFCIWTCLFFYCTKISVPAALKKTSVRLDILSDIDMLLMAEKGIRGEICHAVHRYTKTNNNNN